MRNTRLDTFAALSGMALASIAQQAAAASPGDVQTSDAFRATMTCEHVAVPGRVRCEVEARVAPGQSISWGDVVLDRKPPISIALRGRVGPHDA